MQIEGVMITNGGPHSAEDWAVMTASQIIQIGNEYSGEKLGAARKLELKIIGILEEHHGLLQDHERGQIEDHGHERLSHPLDPTEHIEEPVAAIIEAAKGTPFEDHFAKPNVQTYLRNVIGQHFATSMHIERSWHADRHPGTAESRAFKARHRGDAPAEAPVAP